MYLMIAVAVLYTVMLDLCEDRSSCAVLASPETFTQDPCVGTPKYLEAHYKCRPDEFEHKTVCDGETMKITCGRGNRIAVYSAMFGRTPNGTDRCPATQQGYIDCQAPRTLSEVSSRCQGKRDCAVPASQGVFGDPCAEGINTYLTVSYACVPRKILKQIHHRTNKKKKKKKKKKKDDEKGSQVLDTAANITTETVTAQHPSTTPSVSDGFDQQDSSHIASVTEDAQHKDLFDEVTSESPDITTGQFDPTTDADIHTEAPYHPEETHRDQAEQNDKTSTISFIVDSEDGHHYDEGAEHVVSSTLSPDINEDKEDKIAAYNVDSTYDKETDFQNASQQNSVVSNEENFDNTPFNQISYNSGQDFESMSGNREGADHIKKVPDVDSTYSPPSVITASNPESPNGTKGQGSRTELDSEQTVHSKKMNEVPESGYVTERNLTVLCVNYTKPDVRWVQFVRPRDTFTIGFLRDWFSAIHYIQVHQEKAWLYFTLGICFGIIVMLLVVLIKVCINFRRNIRARLDVSEPTHRSAHINNHSSMDAPMLEHSDSVDRIEVVRFSPRNTLRSQRSNSHHRDLVNYYG